MKRRPATAAGILTLMLAASLLLLQPGAPPLARIDALARARDVQALTALLVPLPTGRRNPLTVLRTGGAYGVGRYGWRALALRPPSGGAEYIVLSTDLTSEDVGELLFRREGAKLRYVPETDDLGVRIARHSFDLRFEPAAKRAEIRDRVTFRARPGSDTFLFRMSPNYRVGSILDAKGRAVPYAQAGGIVMLSRRFQMPAGTRRTGAAKRPAVDGANTTLRVRSALEKLGIAGVTDLSVDTNTDQGTVRLTGNVPNASVSERMEATARRVAGAQFRIVNGLRMGQETFTYTVRYEAIVDRPQYAGSIGPKEATLTNDYWYPMIARGPAPYDITIRSPREWVAVGQGEQEAVIQTPKGRVTKYRMNLPVVYYSVSAAPYKEFVQAVEGRRFSVWSPRLTEDAMRLQTELYAPILKFYEARFGPYPFSGFGALDSPAYGGGALEAYSYATYGGWLPSEDAHEPAHTWWGGIVNNTYLQSFWNESFAVFSSDLYEREVPIGNIAERRLAFIRDGDANATYNAAPLADAGADLGPAASDLGYGKGAQVLQMLEGLIGTEGIFRTMREWARVQAGKTGEWEDYEQVVRRLFPHLNLKRFFDDWIRRPGYVAFDVSDVRHVGDRVEFRLQFKGKEFRIPLDVMLEYPGGVRRFTTLDISTSDTVAVSATEKPVLVSIDPWRRVLRDLHPDERTVEALAFSSKAQWYVDPAHKNYLSNLGGGRRLSSLPGDLNNVFLVGHPDTLPAMRPLCERAGFVVKGNSLTYGGTTIDLRKGAALAVVELAPGKLCGIGLGTTRLAPRPGRARLALTDDLGRFLRGRTEPKRSGPLTFRLDNP